jgi:hypothetical protein
MSEQKPNQRLKPASYPSSEYRILTEKDFNRAKVHIIKNNLSFQASEKIHLTESDSKNRTKSSIVERSICLEVNKTEILRENGE